MIEPVTESDKKEIIALFGMDKKIWPSGIGMNWYWFWREKSTREDWVKIVEGGEIIGSAHWSTRRDGIRNLKDIIIHPAHRGKGLGLQLIECIGRPIILKTDHDSEANGFYRHLGFEPGEEVRSKSGVKLLRVYRLPAKETPAPPPASS